MSRFREGQSLEPIEERVSLKARIEIRRIHGQYAYQKDDDEDSAEDRQGLPFAANKRDRRFQFPMELVG